MSERPTHLQTRYRWDLTPRQREVLELIARGKTNAEIAEELDISLDGAKYHVREILGKLGAESREEAVALWREQQRPLARLARAFAPVFAGSAPRWLIAGVGVAGIAVGFVALALVLSLGGDDDEPPVATPTTTPSPQAAAPASEECTADDYVPVTIARRRNGMLITEVHVQLSRPCTLRGEVLVETLDDRGTLVTDIRGNPAQIPLDFEAPAAGSYLVAESAWENWCEEAFASRTQVTVLEKTVSEPATGVPPESRRSPDCRDTSTPSLLRLLAKDPIPPVQPAACSPDVLPFRVEASTQADLVHLMLYALDVNEPCLLQATATVLLTDANGTALPVMTNGSTLWVSEVVQSGHHLGGWYWSNWCAEPIGARAEVRLGNQRVEIDLSEAPDCTDPAFESTLDRFAPRTRFQPTPTPLPAGLERVWGPPSPLPVWIYEGANPVSTACIEIADTIVPMELAGTARAKPFECDGETWRLTFAVDVTGRHYLAGVQVLVLAQVTLPSGGHDGTCDDIREHLVPASLSADDAAYVTICDIVPMPPGVQPEHEPLVIWARIRADRAPASVPPETPCWELARYLSAPGGHSQLLDVQCTLE